MEDAFRCATRWIKDGRDFGNAGLYAANNQCILVCSLGLHGRLHRDKCNAANLLTSFTYRVSEKLIEVARNDLSSRWISMTLGDKPKNGRLPNLLPFTTFCADEKRRSCSPRDSDRDVEQVDNALKGFCGVILIYQLLLRSDSFFFFFFFKELSFPSCEKKELLSLVSNHCFVY